MTLLVLILVFLLSSIADAATYYVSTTGNNSNDCTAAQNIATPKLTINNLLSNCSVGAGDTINLRAGTYTESILSGNGNLPLGGTSYSNAITFQSYPPDGARSAIIKPNSTGSPVISFASPGAGISRRFFIFKDLKIDGSNSTATGIIGIGGGGNLGQTGNIKFDNVEVVGRAPGANTSIAFNCFYLGGDDGTGDSNWITNSDVHNCGISTRDPGGGIGHAFYVEGHHNTIENSRIYDIQGFGIQNYSQNTFDPSNNTYSNLTVRDVCLNLERGCTALLLDEGHDNVAYNLQIYRSSQTAIGMGGLRNKVFSSTIYNNNTQCSGSANGCISVVDFRNGDSISFQNNVIVGNTSNFIDSSYATNIVAYDSNVVSGTPSLMFVNPAGNDFRLLSGASTLIDRGVTLGAPYNVDAAGTSRPQGAGYDIGAYEYLPITPPMRQLVLALPLDAGVGNTAIDASGLNNRGTFGAGVTWDNSGKYGKALAFDGSASAYITIPASNSLNFSQGMTLEAWIYQISVPTTFQTVITKTGTVDASYFLYSGSDLGYCSVPSVSLGGYITSGANLVVCDTSSVPTNRWTHIAVTFDGSQLVHYRDGQITSATAATLPIDITNGNVLIGASQFGENFVGKIDQPMMYSYARTQTEIQTDMATSYAVGISSILKIAPGTLKLSATDGAMKIGQ